MHYQFASPKRKQLLDRWHEKLVRIFQAPNARSSGIIAQMQVLTRTVASRASTFPEEACCALVDTEFASAFEDRDRRIKAGGNMETRNRLPLSQLESFVEQAAMALKTLWNIPLPVNSDATRISVPAQGVISSTNKS